MADARLQLGQDPVFERFLGAAVGEDARGTDVTVRSMFARLGVDPWSEASELASLPEGPARKRLEALLERFIDVPTGKPDQSSIAMNLLSFLPRKVKIKVAAPDGTITQRPSWSLPTIGASFYWIMGIALILAWIAMLGQGG